MSAANLLLLSPTFHPHRGGAESLTDDLARLLVERGHAVTVLTATAAGPSEPEWRHGARILRRKEGPAGLSWLLGRYRSVIRDGGFDAVGIARIDPTARHVLREHRRQGFRLTAYLHGGELRSLQKKNPRFRRILRWCLREADAVVAVSEDLRREAILFAPMVAEKLVLLPNAIDVAAIQAAPAPSRVDHPYVLFAGRLERVKNPGFLIEAFARIAPTVPDLEVVLVGSGSQRDELHGQVSALGLEGRVRILGDRSREQVFGLMKGASCLVVPSLAEAHPLVVLEAWAAGLPVLASAVKGLRDLVTDDRGALFSLEDPGVLAALLQRAAADPSYLAVRRRRLAGLDLDSIDIERQVDRHAATLLGTSGT